MTLSEPLVVERFGKHQVRQNAAPVAVHEAGSGHLDSDLQQRWAPGPASAPAPWGPASAQLQLGLLPPAPVWPLTAPSPSKLDPDPGGSPRVRPRACSVRFRTQDAVLRSLLLG